MQPRQARCPAISVGVYRKTGCPKEVIKAFRCAETSRLYEGHRGKRFHAIEKVACHKVRMLDAATSLEDLKSPGSQLEAFKGNRAGHDGIRVNDQWRPCFVWRNCEAYLVEICGLPLRTWRWLSINRLAMDLHVAISRIGDIVHPARGFASDTAPAGSIFRDVAGLAQSADEIRH